MTLDLSDQELRVLGSLVEKQLTTPQQYPLTLNALTSACNQSSNRYPIVTYDEQTVEAAVTSIKTLGLARFVHPSHGRSALRFAHTLGEALDIDERQLALLAVLMLRGPQTPGELRSRTERMAEFEDLSDLERELDRLSGRSEPYVTRLARQPGQKEVRYMHLLGGSDEGRTQEDRDTHGLDAPSSGTPVGSQPHTRRTYPAEQVGGRIVVGLDGSPSSKRALEWAARQARLTGASLEVVTSWEFPNSFGFSPPYPSDYDPAGDARRALESMVGEVLGGDPPDIDVTTKVLEGHAAPVLVQLSRGADLLVVGSRGHGEFTGMLIGSVSEHCVTNAFCPVLVFREERHE